MTQDDNTEDEIEHIRDAVEGMDVDTEVGEPMSLSELVEIVQKSGVDNMNQNDTTEDEESGFEHLRCAACEESVGIILEDSQHYAVCRCTNADGELDRMELNSLAFLHPRRWEYV